MHRRTIAALTAATALAAPAAAGAHVTLQPTEAPAGGFTRLDVRVPNEKDDEGTTKVSVKMPPGIFFAAYEPKAGWTAKVERRKLDQPVEAFGEPQSEEVDTVTFTGRGDSGVIEPGQFLDFGLSVNVPEGKPGTQLKFPATQTYEEGEVVRWIGPEDADEPAPLVTLTAAEGAHGGSSTAHEDEQAAAQETAGPAVSAEDVDDKASKGLAYGGLALGFVGLVAGVAGVTAATRARRRDA